MRNGRSGPCVDNSIRFIDDTHCASEKFNLIDDS